MRLLVVLLFGKMHSRACARVALACSLQGMGERAEDELKLGFTLEALNAPNPFATHAAVHQDVEDALRWIAGRSPLQVGNQREKIMARLEMEALALRHWFTLGCPACNVCVCICRNNGSCANWLDAVSPDLRGLVADVNGPMLAELAERAGHVDSDCATLFQQGAILYDEADIGQLWHQCHESNVQVLQTLKEDVNSAELHRLTLVDAGLGRMSKPVPVSEVDLTQVCLPPLCLCVRALHCL